MRSDPIGCTLPYRPGWGSLAAKHASIVPGGLKGVVERVD